MITAVIMTAVKALALIAAAPLASGFIRKVKNLLRMRQGPGVLQPYYNALKLFSKDEVISKTASWIFAAAPAVVFASCAAALGLVLAARPAHPGPSGAALLIASLLTLGLGRFFLALAGLDAASPFGGMGSSREMFISAFAEPAAFAAVFALGTGGGFSASGVLAGAALFMVTIAETSRVPVDNQETHLELTMVHEAMVLEYSGPSLALIELASHIKQMIFFVILARYLFPYFGGPRWGWAAFPAEIAAIGLVIAFIEVSVAKMRLFRAVDFLSFSFLIALAAAIAAGLGL